MGGRSACAPQSGAAPRTVADPTAPAAETAAAAVDAGQPLGAAAPGRTDRLAPASATALRTTAGGPRCKACPPCRRTGRLLCFSALPRFLRLLESLCLLQQPRPPPGPSLEQPGTGPRGPPSQPPTPRRRQCASASVRSTYQCHQGAWRRPALPRCASLRASPRPLGRGDTREARRLSSDGWPAAPLQPPGHGRRRGWSRPCNNGPFNRARWRSESLPQTARVNARC